MLVLLLLTATAGVAGGYMGAREARDSSEARYRQAVAKTDEWKLEAGRWRQASEDLRKSSEGYQQQSQAYQTQLRELQDAVQPLSGISITRASPSGTRATRVPQAVRSLPATSMSAVSLTRSPTT